MLTQTLKTIDLKIPARFPAPKYDAIYNCVLDTHRENVKSGKSTDDFVWRQFNLSWVAVAHRFRTSFEHNQEFVRSMEPFRYAPPAPDSETHYIQERELFGFFVSSLSTIESLYYSLYFIGAFVNSSVFTYNPSNPDQLSQIGPILTSTKYTKYARKDKTPVSAAIAKELDTLHKSSQFLELKEIRNILTHSIVPMREGWIAIVESVVESISTRQGVNWLNIPLDINTTASRQEWLTQTIDAVINATNLFTLQKLKI